MSIEKASQSGLQTENKTENKMVLCCSSIVLISAAHAGTFQVLLFQWCSSLPLLSDEKEAVELSSSLVVFVSLTSITTRKKRQSFQAAL